MFLWLFIVAALADLCGAELQARSVPELEREAYARYALSTRGDAARGRAIFFDAARLGCAQCHRVRGEGGDIGPDLSDVGGKFGREHLIESVLEPSRQIVEGYRQTIIATADGRLFKGLVKSETETELVVCDAELHTRTIRKVDIEERKFVDTSIMSEGLAAKLSQPQFADLIGYLETLRFSAPPTPGSQAQGPITLPRGFRHSKVAAGLTGATALAIAPDGRVFVCEQTGALRIVKDGALRPQPFVALEVDSQWERGLIGVALDPAFASNGHVYVNSVAAMPYPHHRIARFTARGDTAAHGSEKVLLEGDDQRTLGGTVPAGHQGGALHFGGDGKLYIAIGEQTAGQPAQRLDTFQGKLLRINADGTIPSDNPFFSTARGKYRAIWALGLRNPFTFAVQPGTGRIFINDVGQDRWEEINEGCAGANYGWPESEGKTAPDRFRGPIHVYPVASIAGGAFSADEPRGVFPREYRGKYFFMDFVRGWIRVLDPDDPAEAKIFATGFHRPVDLAFAPGGSLYVLVRDAWVIDDKFHPHTGALYEVRYEGAGGQVRE
jgi:putative heme-binding domain-containing protein